MSKALVPIRNAKTTAATFDNSVKATLKKHKIRGRTRRRRLYDIFAHRAIPEQCVRCAQRILAHNPTT